MNNQLTHRVLRPTLQLGPRINGARLKWRTNIRPSPMFLQGNLYSSLRNPRQLGPRGRIRQHVERPAAYQRTTPVLDNNMDESSSALTQGASPLPTTTSSNLPQQPNPEFMSQPALIIGRQIEYMNVFLGYEQANQYKIMDPNGNHVGYIAEEEGFAKSLGRQLLRTHRQLNATVMDAQGNVVFKIHRPFSWINSRIFISTSDDQLIGEVQQRWHLLRRKYDLFIGTSQFATIDTPFLGWDFDLRDQEGSSIGNVSRNFGGFAREIFTDSGQYVLRMDAMEGNQSLTLDQRSVMLACAISIDFDFFSRHSSHGGGGFFPMPFFGGGYENEQTNEPNGSDPGSGSSGPGGQVPPTFGQQEQQQPNEFGDVWMDDEQAGVSSPDDDSWFDTLSDFLKPPE